MPLTATASARAELQGGRTRLTSLRSQVPLSLRETVAGLTVLASAFGPLGGDSTSLTVEVGEGARLAVGSAAAQVAQPGPVSAVSRASVRLTVGPGGELRWRPQPLVLAPAAEHRVTLHLEVADGARATIADTVVLGKSGVSGRYRSRWRVDHGTRPLLHTDLDVGAGAPDGWDGPAVLGGARVLVTVLRVGYPAGRRDVPGGEVMDLARGAVLLSWLGADTVAAARAVTAFLAG